MSLPLITVMKGLPQSNKRDCESGLKIKAFRHLTFPRNVLNARRAARMPCSELTDTVPVDMDAVAQVYAEPEPAPVEEHAAGEMISTYQKKVGSESATLRLGEEPVPVEKTALEETEGSKAGPGAAVLPKEIAAEVGEASSEQPLPPVAEPPAGDWTGEPPAPPQVPVDEPTDAAVGNASEGKGADKVPVDQPKDAAVGNASEGKGAVKVPVDQPKDAAVGNASEGNGADKAPVDEPEKKDKGPAHRLYPTCFAFFLKHHP